MCICVSNKEDILAYQFVFEYIAENARIPPSHLMADAVQSITTAARNIFPEIIRLTCFFHIKQIFRRNTSFSSLKKIKAEKENAELMLSDLSEIQTVAITSVNFKSIVSLRKEKWQQKIINKDEGIKAKYTDFMEYVDTVVDKYEFGMYQNPLHALTNNALGNIFITNCEI